MRLHSIQMIDSQDTLVLSDVHDPQADDGVPAAIWAFMGHRGGVGTTSIAISTATEIVKFLHANGANRPYMSGPRVCLFDTDFENGCIADHLDVEPPLGEEELAIYPERVDAELISSLVLRHSGGFDVLAGVNRLDGNRKVNPDFVLATLDAISELYDYIILDIPRLWTPWTHATIGAADRFNLVTEMTVPALRRLPEKILTLKENVDTKCDFGVVVSKYERRSFRNSLKLNDVKNQIKRDPEGVVCLYADGVKEAINRGKPVSTHQPDGRYAKDIRQFVKQWMLSHQDAFPALERRI